MLDVCNSYLEVEVSLGDNEMSYRLGARIHHQGKWGDNAEATQRRQQRRRSIILKSNSYSRRQAVFASKKKLNGNRKAILENLTKERLRICNIAKEAVEHINVWTADGKMFTKCTDGSVKTLTKSAHLGQITGDQPAAEPGAYHTWFY